MLLAALACALSLTCEAPAAAQSITPLPTASYDVAQAAQCRECSRMPTIGQCIKCAVKSGYGRQESARWCQRNQPACSKR